MANQEKKVFRVPVTESTYGYIWVSAPNADTAQRRAQRYIDDYEDDYQAIDMGDRGNGSFSVGFDEPTNLSEGAVGRITIDSGPEDE